MWRFAGVTALREKFIFFTWMEAVMRLFHTLTLAGIIFASSCQFSLPGYGLTASVEGVVDKADIHEVAGDHYANHSETRFWANFADEQGRLLRIRLSTSKDVVSFSNRKGLLIWVEWRFCDKLRQEDVQLGDLNLFVDGTVVPSIPRQRSPLIADQQGRFNYDAILYFRDARPAKQRWLAAFGVFQEAYDFGREPRDVCVRIELPSMMDGYRTNFARIPKEDIVAAFGRTTPAAPSGQDPGTRLGGDSPVSAKQ